MTDNWEIGYAYNVKSFDVVCNACATEQQCGLEENKVESFVQFDKLEKLENIVNHGTMCKKRKTGK